MATLSTQYDWHWYIRKIGKQYYIGFFNATDGGTPQATLTVRYFYDEVPDDVTADGDAFPLPIEYENGFIKGCVYDILQMFPNDLDPRKEEKMLSEYEHAKARALRKQLREAQLPAAIVPMDLRDDPV